MYHKIKMILLIGALIASVFGGYWFINRLKSGFGSTSADGQHAGVIINGKKLTVKLATSPDEKAKGLSGVDSMPQNEGMLFTYTTSSTPTFTMQGMKFPIDIIWIERGRVVGVLERAAVPESSYIPMYTAPAPVDMVLEVNAGWVKTNKVKTGDEVLVRW
ncbi:MAG: hypothetical protein BWY68_00926 [bacterium ADurb.Bin400]|nr:MAG: hypothetical protein BWY68_00926 [bacterium ADurb.Bin400]